MKERGSLSNLDVADIYEHMLQGDRGGLAKLQQINFKNQIPKFMESYNRQRAKLDTEEDKTNQESRQSEKHPTKRDTETKETISTANLAVKKEHAFLNALKRGAKMGFLSKNETRDVAQHRWVNSSNQNYEKEGYEQMSKKEGKQDSKGIKKDSSVDLKATIALDKQPPIKMYALPKVNKPKDSVQLLKAQSAHIETNKKTIFTDELDRPKRDLKKKKLVDLQDVIGPSKKNRLDFERKNEEERKLQLQIMEYHNSTKLFLADMRTKYGLSGSNKNKYVKRKTKKPESESPIKEMHLSEEQSPLKKTINEQSQHCNDIKDEINQLKILYNSNQAKIDKLSIAMERNPFFQYVVFKQNAIDEESDEQEDIVEPLEGLDHKNRYSHIMAQTREKKWGLMQRVEYETQRASTLEQSRQTARRSESRVFPQKVSTEKRQEKVVINERLKNLLFS